MRKIKVTLKPDGTQVIEVFGASGPDCLDLTRPLEQRLGRPSGERALKPEYEEGLPGGGLPGDREREVERGG